VSRRLKGNIRELEVERIRVDTWIHDHATWARTGELASLETNRALQKMPVPDAPAIEALEDPKEDASEESSADGLCWRVALGQFPCVAGVSLAHRRLDSQSLAGKLQRYFREFCHRRTHPWRREPLAGGHEQPSRPAMHASRCGSILQHTSAESDSRSAKPNVCLSHSAMSCLCLSVCLSVCERVRGHMQQNLCNDQALLLKRMHAQLLATHSDVFIVEEAQPLEHHTLDPLRCRK